MPQFRYTALDASGATIRGTMDATDEASVIAALQRQGRLPVRAVPARGRGWLHMELAGRRSLSRAELANLTRELSIILGAGQDLDRALRFLASEAPNARVAAVLDAVRDDVRDGSALATALATQPASFPPLYIGLVRAGEAGGTLAPTLERLAQLMERERALASTVKSAMIYPALLLAVAIGAIVLLLTQVLPQFVPLFEQAGAALPPATRLLIGAGDTVADWGLFALAGLLLAVLAARQMLRRPGPRLLADRLLLRLPVTGTLAREIVASRFTRTLGTLLINGVPLITALGIVQDAVGNTACIAAIGQATARAKDGAGLAGPLGDTGIMPSRTIHLLRLGEETAQLGPMALRAAQIHEEETRLGIQRLVALLVPAIIIVMGAAVAFIVSSMMLAMLSLNDLAA